MYFPLEKVNFHCHVSLPEGNPVFFKHVFGRLEALPKNVHPTHPAGVNGKELELTCRFDPWVETFRGSALSMPVNMMFFCFEISSIISSGSRMPYESSLFTGKGM